MYGWFKWIGRCMHNLQLQLYCLVAPWILVKLPKKGLWVCGLLSLVAMLCLVEKYGRGTDFVLILDMVRMKFVICVINDADSWWTSTKINSTIYHRRWMG